MATKNTARKTAPLKRPITQADRRLAEKLFLSAWDQLAVKILNAKDGEVSNKLAKESFEAAQIFHAHGAAA